MRGPKERLAGMNEETYDIVVIQLQQLVRSILLPGTLFIVIDKKNISDFVI